MAEAELRTILEISCEIWKKGTFGQGAGFPKGFRLKVPLVVVCDRKRTSNRRDSDEKIAQKRK